MNYQRYLLKLTSIQFLLPKTFQHLAFFYLVVLVFIIVQLSTHIQCSPKFTNDHIKGLYDLSSVPSSQTIKLVPANDISPHELRLLLGSKQARSAKLVEISGLDYATDSYTGTTLIDLFFPPDLFKIDQLENTLSNESLDVSRFGLQFLNLSANSLRDEFFAGYSVYDQTSVVDSTAYGLILNEYFGHLRLAQFSGNKLSRLERKHFEMFGGTATRPSALETLLLDTNEIVFVRHDSFRDLKRLKNVDLSGNKLKILHPLTFSSQENILELLDVSHNRLRALYETNAMHHLSRLYMRGNEEIACDCGLLWLYRMRDLVEFDEFECGLGSSSPNSGNSKL